MNRFVRPILTVLLVLSYMAAGIYFVFLGKANGDQFLTALSSIVSMVVAFWFGERAALKKPGDKIDG